MDITLQIWGGVCYLLNKVFLSRAEGSVDNKKWSTWGWSLYLIGLPAWVIILADKHDWMAASIEAGGVPAMAFGLVAALKGLEQVPRLLKRVAGIFAYGLLVLGVVYSLYDYNGITSLSQCFEIGSMTGFLMGTYLLAKKRPAGWLWFMLMNACMGTLMAIQGKPILATQQAVSLCFVIHGFIRSWRSHDVETA